jgi:hypothetical protein
MPEFDSVRPIRGKAPGDQYSDWIDAQSTANLPAELPAAHLLDTEEALEEHKRMLAWFYMEREIQAENRMEMALDHGFYDNEQWDPDDSAELKARGQMPLVFNEVAPMVDWIIGTERRTRVDWNVLPRAEDDVEAADTKEKVLKFISDINRVPFARSRAFADAVKGGIGWVDDGVRDDPTQDVLYSKYEDWRNVLWDSSCYELDLSDARYIFRWRWVDEDIALMMFPDRANQIRQAVEDAGAFSTEKEEDSWYMGESLKQRERSGVVYAAGAGVTVDAKRRRIKLIECQYRKPCMCKLVSDGPMKGAFFNEHDRVLAENAMRHGATIVDRVMMRVHVAVFTEAHLLSLDQSIFRHNKFGLTPVWCYRRGRDRLPYGAIRRIRDVQQDLNKRASKALFMLNTNQIIAEENAVDDWNQARDEADRPDGVIVKKKGSEFVIRRDTDAATGQLQMMTLDAQSIQKSAGVSNENLGRQTNAVSGEAIKARQLQGSVVTTEPFDNLRYTVQVQGEKQLSLAEQFYTEEKVIRLTGSRGKIDWVKVNQPELQPDGTVRYINDITASQADFVVAEQDYSGTLRQVMFDSLNQMAQRLPPEVSMRLMIIAMEFSDLPNKDEIADQIRQMTGERDPNKEMTPEEAQQMEQQTQMQGEALQMQREQAMLALEEARAKVRELNAKAAKMEAEAGGQGGGMPQEIEQAIRQVQSQAADQIDLLSQQLAKAQSELANRTMQISRDADIKLEAARIDADAKVRVAEIQGKADKQITALEQRMESLVAALETKFEKNRPVPEPNVEANPQPITTNIQIDAKQGTIKKEIKVENDQDGNIIGATSTESDK